MVSHYGNCSVVGRTASAMMFSCFCCVHDSLDGRRRRGERSAAAAEAVEVFLWPLKTAADAKVSTR